MNRVEENKALIEKNDQIAMARKNFSFEGGVLFMYGDMRLMLQDISKSLAVIADALSKEEENA